MLRYSTKSHFLISEYHTFIGGNKLHIIIHLRSAAHRLFFFQNDLKAVAEVKIDGAAVALLYIQLYPPDGKGQEKRITWSKA